MIELKYKILDNNLIKHYAIDNEGNQYYIVQVETGVEYSEAIDVMPCRYTYKPTTKRVEETPIEEVPNDEV